jgi:SAM-dependent methyltransferase
MGSSNGFDQLSQTLIDYDHRENRHSIGGAAAAFSVIVGEPRPASLLDVGCGTGTWLRAASDLGIPDLCGLDGIVMPQDRLCVSRDLIQLKNLAEPFFLGRRFDIALCVEVAEHLPETSAAILISSLVAHSDAIVFSAACPGQPGQHHVNCQWPEYWQRLFNDNGFVCDDSVRWKIWGDDRIEPWYRQNLFVAHKHPTEAGTEPRLQGVIHPMLLDAMYHSLASRELHLVETGMKPSSWYFRTLSKAFVCKVGRRLKMSTENFGQRSA